MMVGDFVDYDNSPGADHHLNRDGYISVTAHNIVTVDEPETMKLMKDSALNRDFQD